MADKKIQGEQVEWISDYTGEDEDEAQVIITEKGIGGRRVALVYRDDDAQLIDRAVYYLRAINPSNPMAVAEGLPDVIAELRKVYKIILPKLASSRPHIPIALENLSIEIGRTLAKIDTLAAITKPATPDSTLDPKDQDAVQAEKEHFGDKD